MNDQTDAKAASPAKKPGLLDSLGWRDRMRIQAKAFWGVCPHSVQGALAWAAMTPGIMLILAVFARLDPIGNYPLGWGGWKSLFLMWIPALLVSTIFLPAARGLRALRAGGLWSEYMQALKGLDANGKRVEADASDWALWAWMLIGGFFVSWLDERSFRGDGMTLGHGLFWHMFNMARVEVCVFIFGTLAIGWLSSAGIFGGAGQAAKAAQLPQGSAVAEAASGWRLAGGALASASRQMRAWFDAVVGEQRESWSRTQAERPGLVGIMHWWADAPFALRAAAMSTAAFFAWWGGASALSHLMDPEWASRGLTKMSWGKGIGLVFISSLMVRLASKRPGEAWGSGLWFGPGGPALWAWLGFALAGIAIDRMGAWRMTKHSMCGDPGIAGGGYFVAVMFWVGLVWGGDAMVWMGRFFDGWLQQAKSKGGWMPSALFGAALDNARAAAKAATAAKGRLAHAVEQKALENEVELARALKRDLEEIVPEAPKRGRGASRL